MAKEDDWSLAHPKTPAGNGIPDVPCQRLISKKAFHGNIVS